MSEKQVARRTTRRPEKICPVCGRPFQWRKKWSRSWSEVKYCSARCRRNQSFLGRK
ncbi:MAG: DUF2256 domain-containing protein [Planctomycetota bacterium]|nr:DUF2256 domain-containing protein [Planctomycetota bacterium]